VSKCHLHENNILWGKNENWRGICDVCLVWFVRMLHVLMGIWLCRLIWEIAEMKTDSAGALSEHNLLNRFKFWVLKNFEVGLLIRVPKECFGSL
jgi:hypothetical protein